ncbi:MAG: histidine phosphatase family protein [Microthrixaceae bacterium]
MARVRSVDLGSSFLEHLEGACELLLVRHGEQELAHNMAMADAVDAPLSELGRRQAAAVADRLSSREIHAAYSSTMQRARDTAVAIAAPHGLPVETKDALVEIELWRDLPQDKGLLDSLEREELRAIMREGNRTQRWDAYPYSEPRQEFRARIVEAIDSIAQRHVGERVVVACHGGVINGYLAHSMESAIDNPCSLHHSSVSTVRTMGDLRRVVQVNDHDHVRPFQNTLNPINAL